MSERDQSVEPSPAERNFFSKHKWRGKLFASEAKTQDCPERPVNEVDEFLQRPPRDESDSARTARAEPRTGGSSDSRLPSISIIDKETNTGAGYQKRKIPRRQGLRVAFDSAPPHVIGEGGDEADLPSIDIAKSRARAKSWTQSHDSVSRLHSRKSSPPPQTELVIGQERSRVLQHNDNSGPPATLQRRSTGLPDAQQANARNEASDARNETVTAPIQRQQPMSAPGSEGGSDAFAAIYVKYTRASPVSPHVDLDEPPTQVNEDPLIRKNDIEHLRDHSSVKAFSSELDPSSENSLTPAPSPQPFSVQEKLPSGHYFPATASSKDPNLLSKEISQRYHKETQPERPMLSPSTLNPTVTSPPLISPSLTGPPLKAPPKSLRTVARNLAGDALNEFSTRVQRFYGMFRLGASANRSFIDPSFEDWIRAGAWWFLKGRGELEKAVRNRPGSRDRSLNHDARDAPSDLMQAHLNLAKASWIISDVTINHSDVRKYGSGSMASLLAITKSLGDSNLAELIEMHLAITASLRALTMSMRRNDKMPPSDFEAQGLESRIWIETPRLTPRVASLLRGNSSKILLEDGSVNSDMILSYPIGDTDSHFKYGSMFVDVVLKSSEDPQQGVHMSCIVSVLRQKNERDLEVVLASQDGKVNLKISSKTRGGNPWRNVHWRTDALCMVLRLSDTLELIIQFQENGFRTLWGIYEYTRKIRKDLEAAEVEEIVFRSIVKCVHYVDPPDAKVFPADPVQRCDVRLFEISLPLAEGFGRRKVYNGHRLIVVTPPTSKVLSKISQIWGKQIPILFSYVRGEEDGPAILLKDNTAGSTLVITFNNTADREQFHSQLDGTFMREEESCCDVIHLQSMHIYGSTSNEPWAEENCITKNWRWDQLRIFNRRPEYFENGIVRTVLSENLRIWMQSEAGAFVDRINLGPGELQLSLSTDLLEQITLLRLPQQDMTLSFASNQVSTSKAKALRDAVESMSIQQTSRTYVFKKLQDLHLFQKLVTGFSVLYDGLATGFAISRRRMVVPIYKKWEASAARLQIVQLDKVLQLVVYCKDFSYGTCMNFVLKTTDNFESLFRSEQYYVRIVDAKFALPKKSTEPNHQFVCLDIPEYPSEHDDIAIAFESEAERDKFGAMLPATVNKFSRLGSLRIGLEGRAKEH